jgi:hypothetical protein
MYILEVQKKTLFIKLKDLFPECEFQIKDVEQLYPLFCLSGPCHRNANCMGKLAVRVNYVFEKWPEADLLMLYFSYRDRPGSQRAGIFWRDMREPRYITMNRTGWEKFKTMGVIYEWHLPNELFLRAPTEGILQLSANHP